MSQLIQFLPQEAAQGCPKAVLPVVNQGALDIAVGAGSALADLLPAIAAGDPAAFGGQVVVKGCHDLLLTISYLEGDDCDPCTEPDALTVTDVEITVPKNSAFPLPNGFITRVQAQALDSTGTPVDVQKAVEVDFYSAYQPCCNGGVLVP